MQLSSGNGPESSQHSRVILGTHWRENEEAKPEKESLYPYPTIGPLTLPPFLFFKTVYIQNIK